MTEKRFTVHAMVEGYEVGEEDLAGHLVELLDDGNHMTYRECCDLLNNLHKENKEVFNSINNRIKFYKELKRGNCGMLLDKIIEDLEDLKRLKND